MLSKEVRRYLGRAVITVELGCFIGAYRVWHKMNTNPDYRKSMHEKYPSVLEMFYQSAERFAGNMEVRKDDYKSWGVSITE